MTELRLGGCNVKLERAGEGCFKTVTVIIITMIMIRCRLHSAWAHAASQPEASCCAAACHSGCPSPSLSVMLSDLSAMLQSNISRCVATGQLALQPGIRDSPT